MTVSEKDVRAAAPANAPEDVIEFAVRLAERQAETFGPVCGLRLKRWGEGLDMDAAGRG